MFFFAILIRLGYDRRKVALPLTALAAITTPLWPYAGTLFNEPLATALVVGAVLALRDEDRPQRGALIGGAFLGALVLVKLAHAVVIPAYALAVAMRKRARGQSAWRELPLLLAPVAVAVLVQLALNHAHFGHGLQTGYPESANGKALNTFDAPLATGLFGLIASPGKGALIFAPLLLLALPWLPRFAVRNGHAAMLAAAPALLALGFYASYTQWEGGFSFGPRYLVPFLLPLLLPLAEPLAARAHTFSLRALVPLAALGAVLQLAGTATDWFAAASDRAAYYDSAFNDRLDHFPMPSLVARLLAGLAELARGRPPAGLDNFALQLATATHSRAVPALVAAALLAVLALSTFALLRLETRAGGNPVAVPPAVHHPEVSQ